MYIYMDGRFDVAGILSIREIISEISFKIKYILFHELKTCMMQHDLLQG